MKDLKKDLGKKLKGTLTEQNLKTAFSGESEARNKYTFFAKIAEEEEEYEISDFFLEASKNEMQHAKVWCNALSYIGTTEENLQEAIKSETFESETMYVNFEKEAKKEGFWEIADLFSHVASVELLHKKRFSELLTKHNDTSLKENEDVTWKCNECGFVYHGKEAPSSCPLCSAKKTNYKMIAGVMRML